MRGWVERMAERVSEWVGEGDWEGRRGRECVISFLGTWWYLLLIQQSTCMNR